MEALYALKIPHSAEFSGVHFKKRFKVLRHGPQGGRAAEVQQRVQGRTKGPNLHSVCAYQKTPPSG